MYEVIKFNNLKESPWKNGLGFTYIIDQLLKNDQVIFKLSMAQINSSNEFSHYKGYTRYLTIIEGDGITINSNKLERNTVLKFDGEEKIISKPIIPFSKVLDCGLIYDTNLINADFQLATIVDKLNFTFEKENVYYLIPITGQFQFMNETISPKDCLKVINLDHLGIFKSNNCQFILIIIKYN